MGKNNGISKINLISNPDLAVSELKSRVGMLESKKIADKNRLNKLRTEIITRLFAAMKEMGVDPSNLNSISSFLQKLEQEDPDLSILFQTAMSGILGNETSAANTAANQPPVSNVPGQNVMPAPSAGGGAGMMSKFNNLQNSIMRK